MPGNSGYVSNHHRIMDVVMAQPIMRVEGIEEEDVTKELLEADEMAAMAETFATKTASPDPTGRADDVFILFANSARAYGRRAFSEVAVPLSLKGVTESKEALIRGYGTHLEDIFEPESTRLKDNVRPHFLTEGSPLDLRWLVMAGVNWRDLPKRVCAHDTWFMRCDFENMEFDRFTARRARFFDCDMNRSVIHPGRKRDSLNGAIFCNNTTMVGAQIQIPVSGAVFCRTAVDNDTILGGMNVSNMSTMGAFGTLFNITTAQMMVFV